MKKKKVYYIKLTVPDNDSMWSIERVTQQNIAAAIKFGVHDRTGEEPTVKFFNPLTTNKKK